MKKNNIQKLLQERGMTQHQIAQKKQGFHQKPSTCTAISNCR